VGPAAAKEGRGVDLLRGRGRGRGRVSVDLLRVRVV